MGIWIGDDAAAVDIGNGRWLLLSVDSVVAGVHADLTTSGLDDFGWKALAASVSDVAAMGGDPGQALVSVAGPAGTDLGLLYEGIAEAADRFSCPVVGGDLVNASDLVVTVAVTGWCDGRPVSRAGARPGDEVWVTGALGGAAAGLRALREGRDDPEAVLRQIRPLARLDAGRAARRAGASAMIDVSDGLVADLNHVAERSGVGLQLDAVPVHPSASLEDALGGGEDYELAFCAPAGAGVLEAFAALDTPIRIGRCTAEPAQRTLGGAPLAPAGWQHRWVAPDR